MMPDPTPTDPAPPETVDLGFSLRLVAIALVSAAVVATLVITIGSALMTQPAPANDAVYGDAAASGA